MNTALILTKWPRCCVCLRNLSDMPLSTTAHGPDCKPCRSAPGCCCPRGCSCRSALRLRYPPSARSAPAPWPHWGMLPTRASEACCPQGPAGTQRLCARCLKANDIQPSEIMGHSIGCRGGVTARRSHAQQGSTLRQHRPISRRQEHRRLSKTAAMAKAHAQSAVQRACRRGCGRLRRGAPGPAGDTAGCFRPGCHLAASRAGRPEMQPVVCTHRHYTVRGCIVNTSTCSPTQSCRIGAVHRQLAHLCAVLDYPQPGVVVLHNGIAPACQEVRVLAVVLRTGLQS